METQTRSQTPAGPDPNLGLRFWVEVGQVQLAGFAECSGLTIETEVFDYPEGGENTYVHKLPVRTKYSNVTLKRGLDETRYFYDWYVSTMNGNTQRRDITIRIYNSRQQEVQVWHLYQAFPVKWMGPDMKADSGAIAVETIELTHHGVLPIPSRGQTQAVTQQRLQSRIGRMSNS